MKFAVLVVALASVPVHLPAQTNGPNHQQQAQAYIAVKRPDLAIKEYKAVVAADPNNLDARANLGVLSFFQNDYGDAIENMRAALQLHPDLWKLQALLGMSEKRTGALQDAQNDLQAAFAGLKEEKVRVQCGLELIEVDYALSDLPKAAETVNVLRQMKPEDPDILYAAHRIYSDLSDETTLALAMVAPDSAHIHQIAAHELARQAKNEAAIAHYREALKLEPTRPDLHFELAEMLNMSSSPATQREAESEYQATLKLDPYDEKSLCRLGDIAMRHSDPKAATGFYSQALKLQPNDADANLGLAKALLTEHEPKQAEPLLERAVRADPFDPAAHYRLAAAYRELGRQDDSRKEIAEFQKLKKMKAKLADAYQGTLLPPATHKAEEDIPN